MGTVIQSICAIALVILAGWVARRSGALPSGTEGVLTSLVYWLAAPALLFATISDTDIRSLMGAPLQVAAVSGIGSALVFAVVAAVALRPSRAELVLGSMSASLNNAAYIGVPIALYVLGDAVHGVPIMVFQLGFFTPMFFVLADLVGNHRRPTVALVVRGVVTNPMVIAAAAGFLCAWFRVPLPEVLTVSTTMVGDAAPPVVLLAFGASLHGQHFHLHSRAGVLITLASVTKLVVQPGIACLVGHLLGLSGTGLLAVTVMAARPTAQNAFIAPTRAHAGQEGAQGTVLVTTFASLPVVLAIAWVFHSVIGI
ncbi:MAG: AEC family transporter [Actinomyces sp.]|nr:AEC family transporter [Actinomyces sp.]